MTATRKWQDCFALTGMLLAAIVLLPLLLLLTASVGAVYIVLWLVDALRSEL